MQPYRPISCAFYDELEARATTRQRCDVVYQNPAEPAPTTVAGVIADLYLRDKVEFMRLASGEEIRLDWLVSVDGKLLAGYC